jgi:hypothetical protein
MADIAGTYRFILDGGQVFPVFGNELNYAYEQAEGSFYFRKNLETKIQFNTVDYDHIEGSSIQTKFLLVIERFNGTQWVEDYAGYFYKTDCDFDADSKLVDIKVSTDDGFDDLTKVLNNEYDLLQLLPPSILIKYDLKPILQVITKDNVNTESVSNDKLTNIVGTSSWEETIDASLNPLDFGFEVTEYDLGDYQIFYRYLTTQNVFAGQATDLRSPGDISAVSFAYNKIGVIFGTTVLSIATDFSIAPTIYGLSSRCAGHETDYYDIGTPAAGELSIPINQSEWVCNSWWFRQTVANNTNELDNSDRISVPNAYWLPTVLQLLLEQETDILHVENTAYSEFFYSTVDPIASEKWDLVISPKSNFANAFYSDPARKATIRLSDILRVFESFKVGWHIEVVGNEKRLRLEHISWYENGGTYGPQEVSIDISQSFDDRNSKPQSFKQNKFSYRKSKMPQRYEFNWQQDVASYFNGFPIEVNSSEINEGQIEKLDNGLFNPDIDPIVGQTDKNLDGWVIVSTFTVGSSRVVRAAAIEVISGHSFSIQNGVMSYQYLHPLYHRYGLPTRYITINEATTTALSIIRNKQQDIVFQHSDNLDPLNLITTELGNGQVDKMTFNIVSGTYKATINLDTE